MNENEFVAFKIHIGDLKEGNTLVAPLLHIWKANS